MMPSAPRSTSQPESPSAYDILGRPDLVNVFQSLNHPNPATAVRAITPERERPTARPECATVYLPPPSPEMEYFANCFAYAYITPTGAACKANPVPFIRDAVRAALPGLQFELLPPGHGADKTVRFRSPDDREAAMVKHPFALDGASVELVREGETSNCFVSQLEYLAHVALLNYPKEQRNEQDIRRNCSGFGHLLEVDLACFAAPYLSLVRAVINLKHPRDIPREVRIRYSDFRFRHVVPVQILRVWDRSLSLDANGKYVPMYEPAAAAAAAP